MSQSADPGSAWVRAYYDRSADDYTGAIGWFDSVFLGDARPGDVLEVAQRRDRERGPCADYRVERRQALWSSDD